MSFKKKKNVTSPWFVSPWKRLVQSEGAEVTMQSTHVFFAVCQKGLQINLLGLYFLCLGCLLSWQCFEIIFIYFLSSEAIWSHNTWLRAVFGVILVYLCNMSVLSCYSRNKMVLHTCTDYQMSGIWNIWSCWVSIELVESYCEKHSCLIHTHCLASSCMSVIFLLGTCPNWVHHLCFFSSLVSLSAS